MRVLSGIFIFLITLGVLYPQVDISIISKHDSVLLVNMPELDDKPVLKSTELPYKHDNSRLKYFRPIYEQVASECSQVSAIAYNFTYEINRLRDLPSDDSANQYPTHFVYNFAQDGNGWTGVSYFHSFEILKTLGCPTVSTYGGMAAGGPAKWMSGYENYLSSMSNRIQEAYQIRVSTEEGLMQLKQWLHNHMDGSEVGGVASFYSNSPWNMKELPDNTPEGGKKVIVAWQGLPTHSMTITGYNDSICWDYNNDGQYTNHLDINGDGEVNMRDWEIGGLLFTDGWGGGINFGDSGRCYMMYKTLAENVYEGGIWNHVVHVVDAKSIDKPALTARINLDYNRRNSVKVSIGVASSISDTVPEYILDYPVFNFQGGINYMQGGTDIEDHKNIEFGLDITPVLGMLETGNDNKFFLIVEERDPDKLGEGFIREFAVIDYTGEIPREISSGYDSIPINHNGITYVPLVFSGELDIMTILTEELPDAIIGEPYYAELQLEGGSDPVDWELLQAVKETDTTATTDTSGISMEPGHWLYGNIPYELPFTFTFYGIEYDSIFIHPAGFVMFKNSYNPWPYLVDPDLFMRNNRCIAPLLSRYTEYDSASDHGIWIDDQEGLMKICWRNQGTYHGYKPQLEFALELHEDGSIAFVYGTELEGHRMPWTCGISDGDGFSAFFPEISNHSHITEGDAVILELLSLPGGITFSNDGILSGVPEDYYDGELLFCAEDADHKRSYRTLQFNASGLGIDEAGDKISVEVYPNPSTGKIYLRYSISDIRYSIFELYSIKGVKVRTLLEKEQPARKHELYFDLGGLAPGVYFLSIQTGSEQITKKIILTGL